jgi:hypothetical protein
MLSLDTRSTGDEIVLLENIHTYKNGLDMINILLATKISIAERR